MDDNVLLWSPRSRRPHVESLFFKLNVPDQRQALWVQFGARRLLPGAGAPYGHVMAVRFDARDPARNLVVKERFDAEQIDSRSDRLFVRMGDSALEAHTSRGRVTSEGHTIAWELRFEGGARGYRHLPWQLLYRLPLPRTKATSPALSARFEGWFEVDGERTTVTACPGMQGHNWGTEHAHRWVWAHGNQFSGERPEAVGASFEGLAAKLKFGPWTTPWLGALCLRYGHTTLCLDTLSRPLSIRNDVRGFVWNFTGGDRHYRVIGRAEVDPSRVVCVSYENPDGALVPCANSTIASLEIRIFQRHGLTWQAVDTLRSAETSALELGGRRAERACSPDDASADGDRPSRLRP